MGNLNKGKKLQITIKNIQRKDNTLYFIEKSLYKHTFHSVFFSLSFLITHPSFMHVLLLFILPSSFPSGTLCHHTAGVILVLLDMLSLIFMISGLFELKALFKPVIQQ